MAGIASPIKHSPIRRGMAMVLATLAAAVAIVAAVTFMAASSSVTDISQTMSRHAHARHIAESGIDIALQYIEQTADWRSKRPMGTWLADFDLYGGSVTIEADFDPDPAATVVSDPSFELVMDDLDTPLVAPPMNGTIGGWDVARTALIETGPTVPLIETIASTEATDGNNVALVTFGLGITGTASFIQVLADSLQPNSLYKFSVDIEPSGVLHLDSSFGFRVLAGSVEIVSTENAATLELPALPTEIPEPPDDPPTPPELEGLLTVLGLADGYAEYSLSFATSDSPEPGALTLELFAESVGILTEIRFDNVRFEVHSNEPVELTATAQLGDASHVVLSRAVKGIDSSARIVEWIESQ